MKHKGFFDIEDLIKKNRAEREKERVALEKQIAEFRKKLEELSTPR